MDLVTPLNFGIMDTLHSFVHSLQVRYEKTPFSVVFCGVACISGALRIFDHGLLK
jgi:hypothetical protein